MKKNKGKKEYQNVKRNKGTKEYQIMKWNKGKKVNFFDCESMLKG